MNYLKTILIYFLYFLIALIFSKLFFNMSMLSVVIIFVIMLLIETTKTKPVQMSKKKQLILFAFIFLVLIIGLVLIIVGKFLVKQDIFVFLGAFIVAPSLTTIISFGIIKLRVLIKKHKSVF